MNFIPRIIASPQTRQKLWVALALCIGVGLTVRLGFWQLSRAAQKMQKHDAIVAQEQLPVLTQTEILREPRLFGSLYRQVRLQGQWMPEATVYLDNRPMNGQAGFWVLTPLRLNNSSTVLVQRGWVPRHRLDRLLLPEIQTPSGRVEITGRITPPPSSLFELGEEQVQVAALTVTKIRENLDIAAFAKEIDQPLLATVLQTDPASEGLLRDWPEISTGIEKHLAYAFQWFAMAAVQLMLYFWYQWIKPLRHAKHTPF